MSPVKVPFIFVDFSIITQAKAKKINFLQLTFKLNFASELEGNLLL